MLVRILSFIASVLGTARYKAVVLSCFALILSSAGIAGVALWHGSGGTALVSQLERSDTQSAAQQGPQQLGNTSKQAIQSQETNPAPQTNKPSTDSGNTSNTAPKAQDPGANAKPVELTLSSPTDIKLSAGGTSDLITASVSEDTNVVWAVTADDGLTLDIKPENTTSHSVKFTISPKQDVDQTRSYKILVQARDAQNTILTSKTITVTIQ